MRYAFYYDETEHSRKINYQTITASNYHDNFIAAIVGWNYDDESEIVNRYLAFESKYEYRKTDGELKSQTMKGKDFKLGFASLNSHTIEFYEDLLSCYDDKVIIYFSVFSKIEYLITQLFAAYHNSILVDADNMKYSIIKVLNVYRPRRIIEAIYKEPQVFVEELRKFIVEQIDRNQINSVLKQQENQAFEEMLLIIDKTEIPEILDWKYFAPFDGFKKLLDEMNISEYKVLLDREGNEKHTLNAAIDVGLENVTEEDSKEYVGIRMADMLAGLISRLMHSLRDALTGNYQNGEIKKTLLDSGWFAVNQRQLNLYKKLYQVVCVNNDYWYKTYAGIYSDDLVSFVALLQFMNHFSNAEEMRKNNLDMQPEYYNAFVCERLQERFGIMRNKLPIAPITKDDREYFYNRKGAKVYKDINRQKVLPLKNGRNEYFVLSVGVMRNGVPVVTVLENENSVCYRLPEEYGDWAMTMVGIANMGEKIFPDEIVFTVDNGKYYVDIM